MKQDFTPTEDELDFAKKSVPIPIKKTPEKKNDPFAPTEDDLAFAEQSKSEPIEEPPSILTSEKNAISRGLVRFARHATQQIRSAVQPGGLEEDFSSMMLKPEEKQKIKETLQPLSLEEEQEQEEQLKKKYPVQPGRLGEYTENISELGPTAVVGPEGIIGKTLRTAGAATLKTEAKKAGLGEGAQIGAEILAYGFPDLKKHIPSANRRQKVLFDFMRNMGMTEEEIAPLAIGENWFSRALLKYAKKTGKMENVLEGTQKGLGAIFDQLSVSPEAQKILTPQQRQNFLHHASNTVHNLPHNLRMEVFQDAMDLVQGPMNGSRMLNFYQDVSDSIQRIEGPRGKRLKGIQNDIIDGISSASPQLGEEIRMTNQLYSRHADLRERLKPGKFEDLINSAKAIGALTYLATGDYEGASILMGVAQAKSLTARFLASPRTKNLQQRFIHAVNNNKISVANSILKEFSQEFKDDFPEFSKELENEKITSAQKSK